MCTPSFTCFEEEVVNRTEGGDRPPSSSQRRVCVPLQDAASSTFLRETTNRAERRELPPNALQQRVRACPTRIELAHVQQRSKLRFRQIDTQARKCVRHPERLIRLQSGCEE